MGIRFNHMELTVPVGFLKQERQNIIDFYSGCFGFTCIEVPMVPNDINLPDKFLISTDTEFSQFFFLAEDKKPLKPESYDHIGFLMDTWDEVDQTLAKVQAFAWKLPTCLMMILMPGRSLPTSTTFAICCRSGSMCNSFSGNRA
jgi:hypothetical protein